MSLNPRIEDVDKTNTCLIRSAIHSQKALFAALYHVDWPQLVDGLLCQQATDSDNMLFHVPDGMSFTVGDRPCWLAVGCPGVWGGPGRWWGGGQSGQGAWMTH